MEIDGRNNEMAVSTHHIFLEVPDQFLPVLMFAPVLQDRQAIDDNPLQYDMIAGIADIDALI